jgi:hypothetical protein
MKEHNKVVDKRTKFREDFVASSKFFKDQIDWGSYLVYDADLKTVDKDDREAIDRLPKDVQSEHNALNREIAESNVRVGDVMEEVAQIVGVNPIAIDANTGIITLETDEVTFEDVDGTETRVPATDVDGTETRVPATADDAPKTGAALSDLE